MSTNRFTNIGAITGALIPIGRSIYILYSGESYDSNRLLLESTYGALAGAVIGACAGALIDKVCEYAKDELDIRRELRRVHKQQKEIERKKKIFDLTFSQGNEISYQLRDEGDIVFAYWFFDSEDHHKHYYRELIVSKEDFKKGVRELYEGGKCIMPVSDKRSGNMPDFEEDSLELRVEKGKIIVNNIETPWYLGELSVPS